jgi:hypothetical protein
MTTAYRPWTRGIQSGSVDRRYGNVCCACACVAGGPIATRSSVYMYTLDSCPHLSAGSFERYNEPKDAAKLVPASVSTCNPRSAALHQGANMTCAASETSWTRQKRPSTSCAMWRGQPISAPQRDQRRLAVAESSAYGRRCGLAARGGDASGSFAVRGALYLAGLAGADWLEPERPRLATPEGRCMPAQGPGAEPCDLADAADLVEGVECRL